MNTDLRQAILDFLTPLPIMQSLDSRQAALYTAGLDGIRQQATLSGSARDATAAIMAALEQYGAQDGDPALVMFLRYVATTVGGDKQARIQDWCEQLADAVSFPSSPASPDKPWDVFVCHAKEDKAPARELYQRLRESGVTPWIDCEDILPGQDWEYEIEQALTRSRYVLALLSSHSVSRKGFIQKELAHALTVVGGLPPSSIFLIPARLDECEPLDPQLQRLHWVDLFPDYDDGFRRILRVLTPEAASEPVKAARKPQPSAKPPASAAPKIGDTWTEPTTGMKFVGIPPGRFRMGQTEAEKRWLLKEVGQANYTSWYANWYANELPRHEVIITEGFWLGKYAVTNAEYRVWKPDHDSGDYQGHSLNADRQPVVNVSWEEAMAFTAWLTQQHDAQRAFRLPTEAEWEDACRAGTEQMFFWGNDPNETYRYANGADQCLLRTFPDLAKQWQKESNLNVLACDDGYAVTSPVGCFQSNAWGLYDMLGNVWEWCADPWHENYQGAPNDGHIWEKDGDTNIRVLRGGSWDNGAGDLRCAYRAWGRADDGHDSIGFRVVVPAAGARTL